MPSDSRLPIFKYAEFNVEALCHQASALRQGTVCACDVNQHPSSGSFNWAVSILFEDGIQWILRSPHADAMSIEMSSKLLSSEAATLKYIEENSDIPVPEVYRYR